MSIQLQPGLRGMRAAAQRNARSHRVLFGQVARSLAKGLLLTTVGLAALLALAYWLSWRLDLGWF